MSDLGERIDRMKAAHARLDAAAARMEELRAKFKAEIESERDALFIELRDGHRRWYPTMTPERRERIQAAMDSDPWNVPAEYEGP